MIKYIRRTYNLLIGEPTAEKIKIGVGTVYPREEPVTMEVKGRDLFSGFPARIHVSSEETIEAFAEVTAQILDTVHNVLEIAPPELVADIAEHGIEYGLQIVTWFFLNSPDCLYLKKFCEFLQSYKKSL